MDSQQADVLWAAASSAAALVFLCSKLAVLNNTVDIANAHKSKCFRFSKF